MNIAEFAIKKSTITWVLTVVVLVVGVVSYMKLPRLEDPEFAIKQAVIATSYPGATAREVEREVTEVIEKACQEMGQLERVESYSFRGQSLVKARMRDQYDKAALPALWDELRRKILNYQRQLPPGAGEPLINDDFGDVYGVYFALTGPEFTYAELNEIAKMLQRELLQVHDVKKVVLVGKVQETIYVKMSRSKMAALGITQDEINNALAAKNLVLDAGALQIGPEFMAIRPSGQFATEEQFGDLLISRGQGGQLIYLRDVSTIQRDYEDPPSSLLRVNGKPAIGIGISTVLGGNVVTMGESVEERLEQLMREIPLGMDLEVITWQSASVTKAINGFLVNLVEAVVIVFVVLLFAMGLRSGAIIGFILVLTIAATFMVMGMQQITLERISLGALIIALGMLVDNAIVIVEGMKVRIEGGEDGLEAAKAVVGQNATPLLGATFVAVAAFASIGTSQDSTGEFCRSLFFVIMISLTLSWVTAMTTTPLICIKLFKPQKEADGGEVKDPYGGALFRVYRKFLTAAIRARYVSIAAVVVMFLAALWGFGFVSNMFFPSSTQPQFLVELFFREGNHIRETENGMARAEEYLLGIEGVTDVASSIGTGHARFQLTYDAPMEASTNYGIIVVTVEKFDLIDQIYDKTLSDLEAMYEDAMVNVKKFKIGPATGGQLQLRFNGPDPAVLRGLADVAMGIMEADHGAKGVRQEWGEKVKVIAPLVAETQARRAGISRAMIADAISAGTSGLQTGVYRERDELIPIVTRAPEHERQSAEDVRDLTIYSPSLDRRVPIDQVLLGFETLTEDAKVARWQRRTMIKIHCDARTELPSVLLARIKPKIEEAANVDVLGYLGKSGKGKEYDWSKHSDTTIPIKYDDIVPLAGMPGYFLAWGGEMEDSAKAQTALAGSIPVFFGLMVLIVVMLFNALRQPLVIWLTVPLSIIGVTVGLLAFDQPFGFMALLGLMSLSGMLIKNAIVLIDQIDLEIRSGKERFQAVVDSGVSRLRPVALAAVTTIMGMIPLLTDAFFVSMAVTIMFGLGFATLLTLIVVPVLYATIFRIPNP